MQKRGQAWVETVVYTLIGLTIMGIVLGIATPRIKQMTDKAIIEQTMVAMNELNQKVIITQSTEGQTRKIDFRIKKGKLVIGAEQNKISFVLENTGLEYSEVGAEISQGDITVLTEENGKKYNINLVLDYAGTYNVQFDSTDTDKILTQAPTAYQLLIKNMGNGIMDVTLV